MIRESIYYKARIIEDFFDKLCLILFLAKRKELYLIYKIVLRPLR